MEKLKVKLFDKTTDSSPISGEISEIYHGTEIDSLDLNMINAADKAASITVKKGKDYLVGDHIQLYDKINTPCDSVSIDPDILEDVDLHKVIFNNKGFDDKAARLRFIHSPQKNKGEFRLRIRIFDKVPKLGTDDINFPTLVFYDWQRNPDTQSISLQDYNFSKKAAFIMIEKGAAYQMGDKIILYKNNNEGVPFTFKAGTGNLPKSYNLNENNLSDKISLIKFDLNPPSLRLKLYSSRHDKYHLNIQDSDTEFTKIDLNQKPYEFSDKTRRIKIETGIKYSIGDHVLLRDETGKYRTNTVVIDPDINTNVDLSQVIINNSSFENKTAELEFSYNPNPSGNYRFRLRLYDRIPTGSQIDHPTLILYDFEFPKTSAIADLNHYHFADKAAFIQVDIGSGFKGNEQIRIYDKIDDVLGTFNIEKTGTGIGIIDIKSKGNISGFLGASNMDDKIAYIEFLTNDIEVPNAFGPHEVTLTSISEKLVTLYNSAWDLGDLNNNPTHALIKGKKGSAVTFFDNRNFQLSENAVRIKKKVDTPIRVNLSENFVDLEEERGDGIYVGSNDEFEWTLFKTVKKQWYDSLPFDFDEFLQEAIEIVSKTEMKYKEWALGGLTIIRALGIGKKGSDNYRVDNCSSVYFEYEDPNN